jgi:hypothetical protein
MVMLCRKLFGLLVCVCESIVTRKNLLKLYCFLRFFKEASAGRIFAVNSMEITAKKSASASFFKKA